MREPDSALLSAAMNTGWAIRVLLVGTVVIGLTGLALGESLAQALIMEVAVVAVAVAAGVQRERIGPLDSAASPSTKFWSVRGTRHTPMIRVGFLCLLLGGVAFAKGEPRGGWEFIALGAAIVAFYQWLNWRDS